MNWADQQPGESRAAWKERTFAVHYGMGARKIFEAYGRMPQPGDTFSYTFPPEAAPTYSGRDDGYRQWRAGEGGTRTERLLNEVQNWDQLGVELPRLILVPTPSPEGVYAITRLEA